MNNRRETNFNSGGKREKEGDNLWPKNRSGIKSGEVGSDLKKGSWQVIWSYDGLTNVSLMSYAFESILFSGKR